MCVCAFFPSSLFAISVALTPNCPQEVFAFAGKIVGEAVRMLREKLDDSPLRSSKIVAPDVSRLKKFGLMFIQDTIDTAEEALSAATFHQYYLDGRKATWTDMIDPKTLDSLGHKISQARAVVRSSLLPGAD